MFTTSRTRGASLAPNRHFVCRIALLGLLVTVGLTSPVGALTAQGCRPLWNYDHVETHITSAMFQVDNVNARIWGLLIADPSYFKWGQLRDSLASGSQPVVHTCDNVTSNAILRVQKLFPPSTPNATGGATGGSLGGGPFARGSLNMGSAVAGAVIVGYIDRGGTTTYHAFRWTEAGGMIDLGTLDPANNANRTSMATGVNADGSVITGFSQIGAGVTQHAFRWTSAGMVDLGAPAGATRDSRALAVNGAGDVLVGDGVFVDAAAFSGFRSGAFRWTASGGFQNLGALAPGFFSVATDVSADGTVIVGQGGTQVVVGGSSINGSRAFRWTNATGLQPIGPLTGHTHAIATGVSDNGKVVVGVSSAGPLTYNLVLGYGNGTAFRWTEAGGIQDLRQLLVNAGLNLTGITLVNATGLSADGQWIVGNAVTPTTPAGETRPFTAKFCDAAIGGSCTPLIVTPTPTFNLTTANASPPSVLAGGSVTSTLTVTPVEGFNQAVTFSCSGLPAESTCAFAPASLTPNAAAITTTLTIRTTAPRAVGGLTSLPWTATAAIALVLLPGLLTTRSTRVRRPWIRPVVAGIAVVAFTNSCGGGGDGGTEPPPPPPQLTGGTPAGTFPIVVTATSGSGATAMSKTVTITLTVTR